MKDNGLLEYYKTLPSRHGFLDISKLGRIKGQNIRRGACQNQIIGHSFYAKCPISNSQNKFIKHIYDAEILLSQVYAKAGLQTAIYLPITTDNGSFLACNDISSPNVIPAVTHLYPLLGSEVAGTTYIRTLPFLSKTDPILEKHDPKQILGTETMREQTLMRLLDVASFNDDRHEMNFFYNVQKQPSLQSACSKSQRISSSQALLPSIECCQTAQDAIFNLQDSEQIMDYYRSFKPMGVVSIDYGASGISHQRIGKHRLDPNSLEFSNDFTFQDLKRSEFSREVIESETLTELVDKGELAQTIAGLNPSEVAQDILETIDYQVDPEYVDRLSQSYDDMAEVLSK